MHDLSLTELRAALDAGTFSAVELAQHHLTRIAAAADLNAFISVDADVTLEAARAADVRLAAGERAPLLGIPLAHKDVFVTRGWRSTAGSRMLEDYRSPFDATVVDRLATAGTVCLGKTNMDEFAMGSSNENSFFGAVRNPWNKDTVPGGSSGGSAAAVAARLIPLATGTDTGGSIRQPAALTGITGIKPTYGRVSRYGMIAFASSLDQAGPMARSAEDCAWMLNAIAGADPRDSTSLERPAEDFTRLIGQVWGADAATSTGAGTGTAGTSDNNGGANHATPLAGLRIGLPKEYFGDGLSADVRQAVDAALAEYRKLGATLVDVSLPKTELSIPVYYVLAPAEASSNLSRFDGVRFGHRAAQYGDLTDMYKKSRTEGFGQEVQRRILTGAYVLSHGYYDAYYLQAQKIRRIIAQDFQQAFTQCDLIMGPVSPTVAWKLGEKTSDPLAMYLADIYTLSTSLAGLPGMSVPAGFGAGGLPVGLQIIGNYFDEARMLQAADAFQRHTDWHRQKPAGV